MQMHAIIELEEGWLNVVVGGRDGGCTRVVRSLRIPLADLGRETIENALRTVGSDMLQGAPGVHVVLGDRRSEHFLSTVPKMSSRDAESFVVREAMRLTNAQSTGEIMVAPRLIKRLPGKKVLVGASVVAKSVWEPVRAAFEKRELPVLSVQTIESCLAMSVDAEQTDPVAVLECNGGRARYVLCVDQTPVKVRRFMIGAGGDQSESTLMTQLLMELPRTMDWLRESSESLPKKLLLGNRLGLGEESLAMLAGAEVGELVSRNPVVECDEELSTPDVAVADLLNRLANGQKPLSLVGTPQLRMPVGAGHILTTLAAASVGILGGLSAVVDGNEWMQTRSERDGLKGQCEDLKHQLAEQASSEEMSEQPESTPQLLSALTMRRPLSRLISEISNGASAEISIEEIKFASTSRVVVTGMVKGSDRQNSLTAMGNFTDEVHALPYLMAKGEDEISEVVGRPNSFRFKLNLAWRTE